MNSKVLPFWKFHGTGNDFVVLDNRMSNIELSNAQIEELCRFHTGIGADGCIVLEDEGGLYRMRYHNSDGKVSSFCGNGSRCFLAFTRLLGLVGVGEDLMYMASDGIHTSRLVHEEENRWLVETRMQTIGKAQLLSEGILIQTGSPHVLIEVGELDFASPDFERQAAQLRYSAEFRAQGVNVNWVLNAGEEIRLRTYERGVERETLSCGTAAVAAAVWWKEHKSDSVGNRVSIQTRGGTLTVFWDKENQVWLRGTVHFTFQGVWQGFGM